MQTRRDFLQGATVTLLFIPIAHAACADGGPMYGSGSSNACNGVASVSSVTDGHTHSVCVSSMLLASPPSSGAAVVTSVASGHEHTVVLSQASLTEIANGQRVTVTTSMDDTGHTHLFLIVRSASTPNPGRGGGGGSPY